MRLLEIIIISERYIFEAVAF